MYYVTKPLIGCFPPIPTQVILLTNSGPSGSLLEWQAVKLLGVPWLVSYNPVSDELAGGTFENITVVVQPDESMQPGTYTETLRITGYSDNFEQDVQVQLIIS